MKRGTTEEVIIGEGPVILPPIFLLPVRAARAGGTSMPVPCWLPLSGKFGHFQRLSWKTARWMLTSNALPLLSPNQTLSRENMRTPKWHEMKQTLGFAP
ncbi:MAG: hypothetical protein ACLP9S_00800 [Syntrophales bacterium]